MQIRILKTLPILVAMCLVPAASAMASPGAAEAKQQGSAKAERSDKIDLNRAGEEELQSVPGIGPALARRIVAHREQNGPFRTVEELVAVPGIGPKTLVKLKPHLTVGRAKTAS